MEFPIGNSIYYYRLPILIYYNTIMEVTFTNTKRDKKASEASMKYLMIENPGVAPLEGLTLLGASLTREYGNDETIGQFGSGSKFSVSLLMRNGIFPIIYCGNLRLEYFTKTRLVKDELNSMEVDQVCVRITGKDSEGSQINRTEDLGWTLGHGVSDWDNVNMALREFVSNAIDRTVREFGNYDQVRIELSEDKPRAKNGGKHTRIFVPATTSVEKYYNTLGKRFLHFGEKHNLTNRVLPKADRNLESEHSEHGVVFKKGVFVRSLPAKTLFDYNFGPEFRLDESRNASDYLVNQHISLNLAAGSSTIREKILQGLVGKLSYYEFDNVSAYTVKYAWSGEKEETVRKNWRDSFNKFCGGQSVITNGEEELNTHIRFKGYNPVSILSSQWYEILKWCGIKTAADVLTSDELEGKEIRGTTPDCDKVLNEVWDFLTKLNRLNGKEKPPVLVFKKVMDAGSVKLGEYKEGKVYINDDIAYGYSKVLWSTMLEEVVHYVTGSADHSRDIQDFLFGVISDMEFKNG